jgi:hypothetical protein
MWNVISVGLEIVLVSVQDRSTIYAERTIGSKIILDALMELQSDVGLWNPVSICLETVLVSV